MRQEQKWWNTFSCLLVKNVTFTQTVRFKLKSTYLIKTSLSSGRDCRWGEGITSALFHPQYHDWGETLEQGTDPQLLPGRRSNMAAHCSGCVFTVCMCSLLCVCAHGLVKCRAQIPGMGLHTWPHVTSLSLFTFTFDCVFFPACGDTHKTRIVCLGQAQSLAYEELVRLLLMLWPSSKIGQPGSQKLDKLFLHVRLQSPCRGLPFSPKINPIHPTLQPHS